MNDEEIAAALARMPAAGRRLLRKYLVADEHARKGLLLALYREQTAAARLIADFVEVLDADPDARRRVTRILGEIEAAVR